MAKHEVYAELLDVFKIGPDSSKNGICITVDHKSQDSEEYEKFGELRIGKGGIRWYRRNKQNPISLTWEGFDQQLYKK